MTRIIDFAEADSRLSWLVLVEALAAGHDLPKADIEDTFLNRSPDTLLSRAAWIDGLGALVKTATIFPAMRSMGWWGSMAGCLYSDRTGQLEALLDFHLVTKWKTAGDSLLSALRAAPKNPSRILIIGAGTVAGSMIDAYAVAFPVFLSRSGTEPKQPPKRCAPAIRAQALQPICLPPLPRQTSSAARPCQPRLFCAGSGCEPGTHVDLIGAYKSDMREADDALLRKARLFLDSTDTVIGHMGEYTTPLQEGVISREDIIADYYDLPLFARQSEDEITVSKNGGGAHLDLMTARYILDPRLHEPARRDACHTEPCRGCRPVERGAAPPCWHRFASDPIWARAQAIFWYNLASSCHWPAKWSGCPVHPWLTTLSAVFDRLAPAACGRGLAGAQL